MNKFVITLEKEAICKEDIEKQIDLLINQCELKDVKKILVIPPDFKMLFYGRGYYSNII